MDGTTSGADFQNIDGGTAVSLSLPANGSTFVVFRKSSAPHPAAASSVTTLAVQGPWRIAFQPGRGAPASIVPAHAAILDRKHGAGDTLFFRHGDLRNDIRSRAGAWREAHARSRRCSRTRRRFPSTAKALGTVWTPPFRVDITSAVHAGRNALQIKIANLWVNRLIGDAQPDVKTKYTFTVIPTYRPDAPLRASGLLGPVTIQRSAAIH